jgi:hypothetical protein
MNDVAERSNNSAADRSSDQQSPWWAFRISTGITARVWFPMLARHRFRVSPSRLLPALATSLISLVTAVPAAGQRRRFGRAVAAEPLPPPVFIVGHWRSGTTFLHELLATDRRFVTPNYLQTFGTDHFLRWEKTLRRFEPFLPRRRPMDNVAAGWDRPQEDEFALLATGALSPYEVMLFPNDRRGAIDHLDVEAMPEADRGVWQDALMTVMQRVAFARHRSAADLPPAEWFLLKSPTHTARIGLLQKMFPDARFIHVLRDPFALFASSEHLWRRMFDSQGFQRPRYGGDLALDRFVNASMASLYRNFDRDVERLEAGRFAEIRYEDLVDSPIAEVTRLRAEIGLPEPDAAALQAHLDDVGDFRRNRFTMNDETAEIIRREWRWYFDRFGYSDTPPS